MAKGSGPGGCGRAAARGSVNRVKPGQLFVHTRWLDADWTPGEGERYADAPHAVCRITAVRRGLVYFKTGAEQGKGRLFTGADTFVERDVEAWVEADGACTPVRAGEEGLDRQLPPTPADAYTLSPWYTAYDPDRRHRYVAAADSPWQARIEETNPGVLHLILGDMDYHDVPVDEVRRDGARRVAELYDETGAVDDIEQILRASVRLLSASTPRTGSADDERMVGRRVKGGYGDLQSRELLAELRRVHSDSTLAAALVHHGFIGRREAESWGQTSAEPTYLLGRPVTVRRRSGEFVDSSTPDRAYCTQYLPDIAASAADIDRYAAAPLTDRLAYLAARSEALAATDTAAFAQAAVAAEIAFSAVQAALPRAEEYEPGHAADVFRANGDLYRVDTISTEDGPFVTVAVSRGTSAPEIDRFSGPFAQNEAHAYISGRIEATDPDRPSLEERLAPFGAEWQAEQTERRSGQSPAKRP